MHSTKVIHLSRLSSDAASELIWGMLQRKHVNLYNLLRIDVDIQSLIDQAIGDMGGIPRFLSYLYDNLKKEQIPASINVYVETILGKVPYFLF